MGMHADDFLDEVLDPYWFDDDHEFHPVDDSDEAE